MTIDVSLLSPSTQSWAQNLDNSYVELVGTNAPVGDETVGSRYAVRLQGMPAAAYLFGQALRTVNYVDTLDGLQFSDARFEFPPGSGSRVTLAELADALRYKYGVDPLIEFAPALGLRAYSVADINNILQLLNTEFAADFREPSPGQARLPLLEQQAVLNATVATRRAEELAAYGATGPYSSYLDRFSYQLGANSKAVLAAATDAELRRDLTEGGEMYIDRHGRFYINGVATDAMDLAVTSRLLAQDNIGAEYKVIMDEYAERNNLIAASRTAIESIESTEGMDWQAREAKLLAAVNSLNMQYGFTDALSELTAGQVSIASLTTTAPRLEEVTVYLEQLGVKAQALEAHYTAAVRDAEIRIDRYKREAFNTVGGEDPDSWRRTAVLFANMVLGRSQTYLEDIAPAISTINALSEAASSGNYADFQAAVTSAKTASGQSDVFGWLRTFDVSESLLWQRDQNSITFAGDIYDLLGRNTKVLEVSAGSATQSAPGFPPLRFDWGLTGWGLDEAYFNQLSSELYPNQPSTFLWDFGEQFVRGSFNGEELINRFAQPGDDPTIANRSLRAFMQVAEVPYANLMSGDFSEDQKASWTATMQLNFPGVPLENLGSLFEVFDWAQWQAGTETSMDRLTTWEAFKDAGAGYSDAAILDAVGPLKESDYSKITALLNTLISNKVRDGELDQAKLQTLTAQLQNNTEAMTAMIKVFSTLYNALAQSLR